MKQSFFLVALLILLACNHATDTDKTANVPTVSAEEKPSFFPVTAYLKGQIYEIAEKGKFPVKYTTVNDKTDSVKIYNLDSLNIVFKEFLSPVIDSANLVNLFKENKFLDQTIDAFTFTYEPKTTLPDSMLVRHWDVYIEPQTSKVKRIYIVKKIDGSKMLQLTWQSNEWCKITTISTNGESSKVEKEEKFSWSY